MRRILSSLLLLATLLPAATPAFGLTATQESFLPACCRRDGAHHCAMQMAALAGPAKKSVSAICTEFPHRPQASTAAPLLAVLVHPASFSDSHEAATQTLRAQAVITNIRTRPTQRGPPSLLN